jgi:IS1 family transposase
MDILWLVGLFVIERPRCPRCGSLRVVKSGHILGRQRWWCKACRYQFTTVSGHGTAVSTQRAGVSLYGHGLSFRTVARLLGTTAQSVLRWGCSYVDGHCVKPEPGAAVVIELDEMWHFVGSKANKVWIWKASDRERGILVDWECGRRDEATFRRLLTRLQRWKVRLFCTDAFVVYDTALPVGRHDVGKDQTVALERTNAQQRHWTAALRRRSIVVSKSLEMIERRMALFAHLHVNRDAPPDMYPGQSPMNNPVGSSVQRNPCYEQRNVPTRVPLRSGTLDPS